MKKENDNLEAPWWQSSLILFGKLSSWIAGPILAAIFIGKFLDKKYGTEPWLFLLSVGAAFFISTFGIVKDAMREMKKIEECDAKARADKEKEETKSESKNNK